MKYEKKLPFTTLGLEVALLGEDCLLILSGGDLPHIGSVVMALPRPSLTGSGETSCTSSVLNRVGHKDEAICRMGAELVCKATGRAVVCTGGVHVEGVTPRQIEELLAASRELFTEALNTLVGYYQGHSTAV